METGAHPLETIDLPLLEQRYELLHRFYAQRARLIAERERLAEIAEEGRALGLSNLAAAAERAA